MTNVWRFVNLTEGTKGAVQVLGEDGIGYIRRCVENRLRPLVKE